MSDPSADPLNGRFDLADDPDTHRPRNPNIPYFATRPEFRLRPQPRPADLDPKATCPVHVEPNLRAVEVYEAILRQKLGHDQRLKVYISKAGVLQLFRLSKKSAQTWQP